MLRGDRIVKATGEAAPASPAGPSLDTAEAGAVGGVRALGGLHCSTLPLIGEFKQRIEALRAACSACHAAEGVPFIRIGVPTARRNPLITP